MRVAIVGCGRAGAQHAAAVSAAGGRVVAVCDVDPRAARRLSSILRVPVRLLPELLGDQAVDAIAVCTTPDSHLAIGLEALAADKATVIEKPPALTREGVEELDAAARAYGRPLAVMLQHRHRLPAQVLAARWSAEANGVVEVYRHRPAAHYARRTWRRDPSRSGGGFFAHLAIHYADLAFQLLGEPETVQAVAEARWDLAVDVRAALSMRMRNGALLTVSASSLPAARLERLSVMDGSRTLTITDRETRYAGEGEEVALDAPPTSQLRASVYRETAASLLSGEEVRRSSVADSAGVVTVLGCVAEAVRCGHGAKTSASPLSVWID